MRADILTASSYHSRMFPVGLSCRVCCMMWEGGLEAVTREAIVTSDSGDWIDWKAATPGRKRGGTSGKGSSNCSKGGGCTYWGGKGVLFVFVFWGERET